MVSFFISNMNYQKVKLIAHNLKLLAQSLEDAIKEDVDAYQSRAQDLERKPMPEQPWFPPSQSERLGYRYSDDDDGYAD